MVNGCTAKGSKEPRRGAFWGEGVLESEEDDDEERGILFAGDAWCAEGL